MRLSLIGATIIKHNNNYNITETNLTKSMKEKDDNDMYKNDDDMVFSKFLSKLYY